MAHASLRGRTKLSSREVTWSEAAKLVFGAFRNTSWSKNIIGTTIRGWWPDSKMAAPTPRDLVRVAKTIMPRPWTEDFDCDDFALEYSYWALAERIDGLTWCVGRAIFETTPSMATPHEMNVAVADVNGKLTLLVMEPQKCGDGAARHFLRKPGDGYVLRSCIFG